MTTIPRGACLDHGVGTVVCLCAVPRQSSASSSVLRAAVTFNRYRTPRLSPFIEDGEDESVPRGGAATDVYVEKRKSLNVSCSSVGEG